MALEDDSEHTLVTKIERMKGRGREVAGYILSLEEANIVQKLYDILKKKIDDSGVDHYAVVDIKPVQLLEALQECVSDQPLLAEFLTATDANPTAIAEGLKTLLEKVQGDLQERMKSDYKQVLISSTAIDDYDPEKNVPPAWGEAANFLKNLSYAQSSYAPTDTPILDEELVAKLPKVANYWENRIRYSPESFVESLGHKGYDIVTLMHELTDNQTGKHFGRAVMESKLRNIIERTLPNTQAYLEQHPRLKPDVSDILDTAIAKLDQIRNGGYEVTELQRKVGAAMEFQSSLGR